MDIPSLATDRLTLRGHRIEDYDECVALWGDAVVTRYIGGRPFTAEEVWARVLRYVGHWALLGFGYWVVRERATGRLVGEVGFADFHRDIVPSFEGRPEAGWVLAPWAHGKGCATEAVGAVLAWGDAHLKSDRTVCLIDPDNLASIRVAEKVGYRELARTTYKGDPSIVFERQR
ncbi:MAG TPA: GNAT family N-acetyltransferase [Kofleriaceae bacterium]|jgi:RimJ/RimL family protein N-acetyltransferase|nr:GNAT family N-acetyltransferase [Kofleriaceae bacterium]